MVYLLKMVIFHGKLLNNQMVSLFPNDEKWVFDFDPYRNRPPLERPGYWLAGPASCRPRARCTWRFVPAGRPLRPSGHAIKHGIDKGIIPLDCNWTKIDYIYIISIYHYISIYILYYNIINKQSITCQWWFQMLGSSEASKIVDSRPGTRRKMAGQSWHRGGVLSRLS